MKWRPVSSREAERLFRNHPVMCDYCNEIDKPDCKWRKQALVRWGDAMFLETENAVRTWKESF